MDKPRYASAPWKDDKSRQAEVSEANDSHIVKCVNMHEELLKELRIATKIIMNALNIMTLEQKDKWGAMNEADNLTDDGVTRNFTRQAIIAKAEGKE